MPPFSIARLETARLRRLRPARGRGLAALRLVGHRLPGRVAEPRVAPEDEPPGPARGVQGDRGQPADSRPHPRPAAPDAPPPRQGRCGQSRGGAHQPHPLCRGAGLRLRHHGSAQGGGQGPQPAGRGDQGRGPLGGRAHHREPAAGAARSTARSRSARPFQSISTPPWPPFWPISTASAWRPSCASAAPAKPRRARSAQAQLTLRGPGCDPQAGHSQSAADRRP